MMTQTCSIYVFFRYKSSLIALFDPGVNDPMFYLENKRKLLEHE